MAGSHAGRPAIYPWAEWLEAALDAPLTLRQGVHYDIGTASMIQQLRNAAAAAGRRIRVREVRGGIGFVLANVGPRRRAVRKPAPRRRAG
jgi:hypothetical protein